MRLNDYLAYLSDRRGRMRDAFLHGVLRGFGMVVGFAVLGAVMAYLLGWIARSNLPGISDFVAEIVRLTQSRLR